MTPPSSPYWPFASPTEDEEKGPPPRPRHSVATPWPEIVSALILLVVAVWFHLGEVVVTAAWVALLVLWMYPAQTTVGLLLVVGGFLYWRRRQRT